MATLFLLAGPVHAQYQVTGQVITDEGTSLPGVNVAVMGTTIGTTTDLEGRYNLNVPSPTDTLVFSFIGFETQEIPIANRSVVDVAMAEDVEALEEVVVVGYGTQRKVNLTGAVASVEAEEMAEIPVPTVTHALQGMAPGLQLLDGGDRPGRNALNLLVRGQGTLGRGGDEGNAAARPLVLIDGLEGNLATVDMDDVESISVLKDAASAAIYGSRAANGVILVTTKRGSADRLQITYSGYVGMQDITAWPERVSTETHMRLANLARSNYMQWCLDGRNPNVPVDECETYDSYQPRYSEEYIQNTIAGTDPDARATSGSTRSSIRRRSRTTRCESPAATRQPATPSP